MPPNKSKSTTKTTPALKISKNIDTTSQHNKKRFNDEDDDEDNNEQLEEIITDNETINTPTIPLELIDNDTPEVIYAYDESLESLKLLHQNLNKVVKKKKVIKKDTNIILDQAIEIDDDLFDTIQELEASGQNSDSHDLTSTSSDKNTNKVYKKKGKINTAASSTKM